MLYRKVTEGFVIQVFNDAGECIAQRFVAAGDCDYETGEGDPINSESMPLGGNEYHPFDMVAPLPTLKIEGEVLEALNPY